jgi:hypothetical protein
VKDFGQMPLLEFAELYNGAINSFFQDRPRVYLEIEPPVELLFSMIFADFQAVYGIEKREEMRFRNRVGDTSHKYGVKFEISLSDSDGRYDCHPIYFDIIIWIDGVKINATSWLSSLHSFQKWGGVYHLNKAHEEHLRALHYAAFKENMARITEGIVAEAMHPRRLMRHIELGGEIEDF